MGSNRSRYEIDSALCKKGFHRKKNGRHIVYFLSGNSRIHTMMSHGTMGEAIGADLISKMARQLRLTKTQFLDFIDCTISEEDYRTILRSIL